MFDRKKIEEGVRLILEGIGENPDRYGIRETPSRIARMCEEIFRGLLPPEEDLLKYIDGETHDEMVLIKEIPFYSVCEHHLLPFFGYVHIAYIPAGRIVGLSELPKAVDYLSKRPQVQERLTKELADLLMNKLKPEGCIVVIEAEHLCMSMRGIKKIGTKTLTSAVRGIFRRNQTTRQEALELMGKRSE
ncbi:MAG TPA: GTP cyclohydrolase I FolE [Thermodesulfovibrio thiophilus]|uniref:GTP cyclohydrolase I FolE n=1 Tax=Thermodesulfovibrio thiophilus TaxID=340095 RepID=UPI0003F85DFA|nr:GTP cyclohydrolase I FolE [Thermodesulfovibrio thiophilus]HHW19905.1 GTP cyclohydrolase I FolE [Thermodesulfovibrio thiophilus]HOA82497.1 GTP cyclohydrolase I FolE [Thermodesulfovibrio thiophilus]HQA03126.1 GTP cyclohydrolase I FolE [Thermodesulfovibrio thiophilus]HQD35488.1 GTP cyclohydrolase I FolE [Thermodesulfovibrio thiophilus]